jgi:nanoRNase/pAp phosphatase (c-di-AMP/oligoRNAs hydrolase)
MFPKLPRTYFILVARALERAQLYRNLVCSHLGPVPTAEIVAEMADFLVRQERITWAFCTGRFKDSLILSLRTTNSDTNAGQVIRKIVKNKHMAGGHDMTGGGYFPLDEDPEGEESLEDLLTARFLKEMGHRQADWKPLLNDKPPPKNNDRKTSDRATT